jgi:2-keto-4-pentenoate hydratase/2-oxohepta-3-ene-1,7-dioic acid hydratase in catechol pathway
VHHEIELGFLICKTGRNIAKEDWKNHVGGYFLAIDFTDRDKQAYLKKNSFPWDISKG